MADKPFSKETSRAPISQRPQSIDSVDEKLI